MARTWCVPIVLLLAICICIRGQCTPPVVAYSNGPTQGMCSGAGSSGDACQMACAFGAALDGTCPSSAPTFILDGIYDDSYGAPSHIVARARFQNSTEDDLRPNQAGNTNIDGLAYETYIGGDSTNLYVFFVATLADDFTTPAASLVLELHFDVALDSEAGSFAPDVGLNIHLDDMSVHVVTINTPGNSASDTFSYDISTVDNAAMWSQDHTTISVEASVPRTAITDAVSLLPHTPTLNARGRTTLTYTRAFGSSLIGLPTPTEQGLGKVNFDGSFPYLFPRRACAAPTCPAPDVAYAFPNTRLGSCTAGAALGDTTCQVACSAGAFAVSAAQAGNITGTCRLTPDGSRAAFDFGSYGGCLAGCPTLVDPSSVGADIKYAVIGDCPDDGTPGSATCEIVCPVGFQSAPGASVVGQCMVDYGGFESHYVFVQDELDTFVCTPSCAAPVFDAEFSSSISALDACPSPGRLDDICLEYCYDGSQSKGICMMPSFILDGVLDASYGAPIIATVIDSDLQSSETIPSLPRYNDRAPVACQIYGGTDGGSVYIYAACSAALTRLSIYLSPTTSTDINDAWIVSLRSDADSGEVTLKSAAGSALDTLPDSLFVIVPPSPTTAGSSPTTNYEIRIPYSAYQSALTTLTALDQKTRPFSVVLLNEFALADTNDVFAYVGYPSTTDRGLVSLNLTGSPSVGYVFSSKCPPLPPVDPPALAGTCLRPDLSAYPNTHYGACVNGGDVDSSCTLVCNHGFRASSNGLTTVSGRCLPPKTGNGDPSYRFTEFVGCVRPCAPLNSPNRIGITDPEAIISPTECPNGGNPSLDVCKIECAGEYRPSYHLAALCEANDPFDGGSTYQYNYPTVNFKCEPDSGDSATILPPAPPPTVSKGGIAGIVIAALIVLWVLVLSVRRCRKKPQTASVAAIEMQETTTTPARTARAAASAEDDVEDAASAEEASEAATEAASDASLSSSGSAERAGTRPQSKAPARVKKTAIKKRAATSAV